MTELQLPLSLRLDTEAAFDNFYISENSRLAVQALRSLAEGYGDKWVYLHAATGRSHLLQACAQRADALGQTVRYVPLRDLCEVDPDALLEGVEELDLLCLDDIDGVVGDFAWERSLFNCYNSMMGTKGRLLVSSLKSLTQMDFALADFESRMQSLTCYQLPSMSEADLIAAFQFRARLRGLEVSLPLAEFILARCQRDVSGLFRVLEVLDKSSLVEKRKLTVPFVKKIMGW